MTLEEQLTSVRETWKNWDGNIYKLKVLILHGIVRPKVISPEYRVRIKFEYGRNPTVNVLSPDLKLYPGKKSLPHVFADPSDPLCLFLFEFNNKKDPLAESVIVWITWWLYFYEIWQQTGKWTAPGTHPERW